jgi:terminase small subunit-like protein
MAETPGVRGKRGRPTRYTQGVAELICERLAVNGESLTAICKSSGMPSYSAVMEWLDRYPNFAKEYARARDIQIDLKAEEIVDIADDSSRDWITDADGDRLADHNHISRDRLRVDARKLKSKKYGDKLLHTGAEGEGPVAVKLALDYSLLAPHEMVQLRALIEKAMPRQTEESEPLMIEGEAAADEQP